MLSRFCELQEALRATMPNLTANLPVIPFKEWRCIEQLIEVLKPFYEITVMMSGENYLTASKGVVVTHGLLAVMETLTSKDFYAPVKDVILNLKAGILTRLSGMERNEAIGICTSLDPRFEEHGISDRDAVASTK